MLRQADTVARDALLSSDICIIGAGAAGICIARSFADGPQKVILLESGELESTATTTSLNKLETNGLPISEASRVRSFGGTTKAWYGRWRPLDFIDFKKRDWIPYSGWPITEDDLAPYYKKAEQEIGTPVLRNSSTHLNILRSSVLKSIRIPVLKKRYLDFGKRFRHELESSPHVDIRLGGTVTKLIKDGSSIDSVLVRTLAGNTFSIKAGIFILATGGIENARLLLLSDTGNEHDQVGRYYMDHPKGKAGIVHLSDPHASYEEMSFGLADTFQASHHVLNSYVTLEPKYARAEFLEHFPKILRLPFHKILKLVLGAPRQARSLAVRNYMEQTPNPENRVTLGESLDAFGNKLPKINWNISDLDKKTMVVLHQALKNELDQTHYGTLESPLLAGSINEWPIHEDASHHMGTTRIGTDPHTSVVDKNCKVHSVDNLYIAGSSIFPTSGYANPTATIIALALRLADHLSSSVPQGKKSL